MKHVLDPLDDRQNVVVVLREKDLVLAVHRPREERLNRIGGESATVFGYGITNISKPRAPGLYACLDLG